jgi:hypothetical protein
MRKSIVFRLVRTSVSLCFLVFCSVSCGEDEPEPQEQEGPSITSFTPTVGLPGVIVTISGKSFDTTPANNTVKFSNVTATVNEATETSLKVIVPQAAVTGKIEVTVKNKSALSAADFVIPPSIMDFTPKSGVAGSNITISGTGFSSTVANNIVKINGVTATVTAASATLLTVQVPSNSYSGIVSVAIGSASAATTDIFKYLPAITAFDPLSGPIGSNVTITGSGFSQDPESNVVKIGDVVAEVISGNANQLVIKVAEGTETGNITVSSGASIATSAVPFTVIVQAWRAGDAGSDSGFSIGVDGAGNFYVAGSFVGTVSFGATTLSGDGEEIFVAKYDATGGLVWAISAGGSGPDRGASIIVDNAGNSYITGYYTNTADFGPVTATASGYDPFVAKVNTSGVFQWVQTFGSSGTDLGNDITFADDGNIVAVGDFFGTVNIGATSLVSPGGSSIYVAKFNKSTGSPIWANSFGGTMDDGSMAISVNGNGDIYVGGSFFGTVTLGTTTLTGSAFSLNSFVLKLNNLGVVQWAKHFSSGDWNNVLDIATDAGGNCVATGYFRSNMTAGGTVLDGINAEEIFLIKLESSDGDVLFAKRAGGTGYEFGRGVAIDATGNIFISGDFEQQASFGDHDVTSKSNTKDTFVAKYDSNGNALWVSSSGGHDEDFGYDIALGADGAIYITGSYRNVEATFGSTILDNEGSDDIFIYRILP